jgi:hypothetical protein
MKMLAESSIPFNVVVFNTSSTIVTNERGPHVIDVPEEIDSPAKLKNLIIDWTEDHVKKGFLHIVESSVEILKDPAEYVTTLEKTMEVLDYRSRFSTVTDPCNYVFNRFNPRVQIDFEDDENIKELGLPQKISFTSHANTAWTTFIVDTEVEKIQRFNENFTVMMYVIIEYFAKRKAQKTDKQLYYMNQYLSIDEELGVIRRTANDASIDQKTMSNESKVFNDLGLDTTPDNNIDAILERVYNVIAGDEKD